MESGWQGQSSVLNCVSSKIEPHQNAIYFHEMKHLLPLQCLFYWVSDYILHFLDMSFTFTL